MSVMEQEEQEEVSARVLLSNILQTETQRSPVTRSMSHNQHLSTLRRSSRMSNRPDTPQVSLRNRLKQKLHESATRSPLQPSKRARTPATLPSHALYDDGVTPRGLLRGIIQTETEASLLLSGQAVAPPGDQQDDNTSIHSNRRSDTVSDLKLPDLATEPLTHVIRGMSRRRPPPTFNVSAFEKHLTQSSGEEEVMDVCQENPGVSKEHDLSSGSKSVLSLTLKTPFENLRSEKPGLRRKAAGQRKQVSVDTFDEAVQKRLETSHNQDYTEVKDGRTLQDSAWHKFTLGLSNISVPELTDVVMSNTELYAQPQASDGMGTPPEMKIDGGGGDDEEISNVIQDQQSMNEGVPTPQSDPSEQQESDSQSEEEEEVEKEIIPSSVSLCPEDIPFAPTQAMTKDPPDHQQEYESDVQDAQVRDKSLQEEEPSHLHQRITRRAYHSEGGAIKNRVMARGRDTKSLGRVEKELQSFISGPEQEELISVDEEPHHRPSSSSTIHTKKPSSFTHQDSLKENANNADVIHDLGQTESEDVAVDVRVSATLDMPASVEEEEQEQEEEEEEEREEEEELEKEEQVQWIEENNEQRQEAEEDEEVEDVEQEASVEDLEEELDEDAQSEELSMQTPGFIRQRKHIATPGPLATPTVHRDLIPGTAPKVTKPRPKRTPRHTSAGVLPKSYVMSVFKHFAKTKVASDVYLVISDILQKYFDRLADDLEMYSAHAKRKTIEVEDVELLMRRQGFVTDRTPVNVLIEKFLPLEYRKLLIPVATSGNKVLPNQRR